MKSSSKATLNDWNQ